MAGESALDADGADEQGHGGLVTLWFRSLVFHYATLASKANGLMPPRYEWFLKAPVLSRVATEIPVGFKELDRFDGERAFLQEPSSFTKRSRIHTAAEIMQAQPRIRREPLQGRLAFPLKVLATSSRRCGN